MSIEWKLVPVEPTKEMIDSGVYAGTRASPYPWCPKTWAAMLDAAPAPQMPELPESNLFVRYRSVQALSGDINDWTEVCGMADTGDDGSPADQVYTQDQLIAYAQQYHAAQLAGVKS